MFWNPERIAFFIDAAEHSDFYQRLAEIIAPHVSPQAELMDIGCGLGYLGEALRPLVKAVHLYDIDERVLEEIQKRCGLEAHVLNFPEEMPKPADILLTSFFGRIEEYWPYYQKLAPKHILIKNQQLSEFYRPQGRPCNRETDQDLLHFFLERDIPCLHQRFRLRFDQPFRSRADALNFMKNYHLNSDPSALQEYMKRIVPQDDPQFPWILPIWKNLGMIVTGG